MDKRVAGRILEVKYGPEDHGILTCTAMCEFASFVQGFGGLCLDARTGPAFKEELMCHFGVTDFEKLVGKKCFGLWCLGELNEPCEGLENEHGQRFTITSFIKRHLPEKAQTRFEKEAESLRSEIAWAERRAKEARYRLDTLRDRYTDWETAP